MFVTDNKNMSLSYFCFMFLSFPQDIPESLLQIFEDTTPVEEIQVQNGLNPGSPTANGSPVTNGTGHTCPAEECEDRKRELKQITEYIVQMYATYDKSTPVTEKKKLCMESKYKVKILHLVQIAWGGGSYASLSVRPSIRLSAHREEYMAANE